MKNVLKLAAAIIIAAVPASAYTFNDATPTCILCGGTSYAPGVKATGELDVGDIYRLSSSSFVTNGTAFDVGLKIVRRTLPIPDPIKAFNTVQLGGFVQYQIRLLTKNGGFGDILNATTNFLLLVEDIDSNPGENFTEYAGVSGGSLDSGDGNALQAFAIEEANGGLTVLGDGSDLSDPANAASGIPNDIEDSINGDNVQVTGFNPGEIDPNVIDNFTFAWAKPDNVGTPEDWTLATNTAIEPGPNDPNSTAAFFLGGQKEFNFIWGTTGPKQTNSRAWNMVLTTERFGQIQVPEIDGPVLVQVGFALAGLYVLMLGRRRREDEVEMSHAAA